MAAKRRKAPKRTRPRRRRWFWALGAAVAGAAAYFLWHRPAGSIPVPGQAAEPAAKAPAPSEQITDSDRDALDRVLRERPKPH